MILESNIYLIINLLIYACFTFWAYKHTKGTGGVFFVFAFYTLSALATILFYNHPLTKFTEFDRQINLSSLLFFAALIYVITAPISVFDKKVDSGKVYVVNEKAVIWFLGGMLAIQALLYVACLPYLLTVWNSPDLGAARSDLFGGDNGLNSALPGPLLKLFVYCNWFRNVAVPIAIYAFLFIKRHRKLVIFATISILFYPMFYSMLYIMRSQIFLQIVTITFFLIIFRKYLSKKTKKYLLIIGSGFLLFAASSLILVSNGRFGDMVNWMYYRYLGESFINFSTLWQDQTGYTEGMAYFRKLLTGEDFATMRDKWDFIRTAAGVDPHVFNGSIGQLMTEFGGFATSLIYLIIGSVSYFFFKSQKGITLPGMLLLGLISQLLFYGIYVFPFQSTAIIEVFIYVVFIVYFNLNQKPLKRASEPHSAEKPTDSLNNKEINVCA